MFSLLVIATPHYAGTHTIMNFLDSKGYGRIAENLIYTKDKRNDRNTFGGKAFYSEDDEKIRHIWLGEMAYIWEGMKKENYRILDHPLVARDKVNLIHGHIIEENIDVLKQLNYLTRIIVTARDPLASLLSCRIRDLTKEGREELGREEFLTVYMDQCLKEWELFATEIDKLDPYYVPVDLDLTGYFYRGIDFSKIIELPHVSSRGDYKFKKYYEEGNLEDIKQNLGDAYDRLIDLRPILQPVLEKIGYRDLLWW